MHLPLLCTSQILILESMEPDSNRWPVPGKNWIFDTPWELFKTSVSVSYFTSSGGYLDPYYLVIGRLVPKQN
jgi:hypothetical protein